MFSNHYSVELVADMLSTSKSTVNSWIRKKTIKSIKPNGKTLIQKTELKKFKKLSFLFSKNKYNSITENALAITEMKLTRAPISLKIGNCEKKLPKSKYKGVPGGWGTPIITDVAINSPQSQNEVVGAIVIAYIMNDITNEVPAIIWFKYFIVS